MSQNTSFPSIWKPNREFDPQFAQRIKNLKVLTLANGLRVLIMHDPQDRATYLEMNVNAGSIHQSTKLRGVAHFVEHMVYQGTTELPDTEAIVQFAQEYDLQENGFTTHDRQGFHIDCDNDQESLEAAFRYLSQITLHSTFPEAAVENQREVIIAERTAELSDPWDMTYEAYYAHIYGPEHPFGGAGVLGSVEELKQITREDLLQFYDKYFQPANMQLLIVGGASEEKYAALAEKFFNVEKQNLSNIWQSNPIEDFDRLTKPHNSAVYQDFEYMHTYAAIYLPKEEIQIHSPEYYALDVASRALYYRMFLDLREKQGLAYQVASGISDSDHGFLYYMFGEFPPEKYEQGLAGLQNYITEVLDKPITQDEFRRAVRAAKSIRWASSGRSIAKHIANYLFSYGQLVSPEAFIADYEGLSLEQVNNLTQMLLKNKPVELIEIGPNVKR